MRRHPLPFSTLVCALVLLALAVTPGGCGSKISEANYYRVQYGMTEKEVEDLLGPAHGETVTPATSQSVATGTAQRKVKTWSRDALTIRVEFLDGVVVGRGADGMPAEAATPVAPVVKT
jgi:hypothetical protein